jgi:hypothetical protein
MGVRHRVYKHIQGVQFHPESIRTQNGMQIVGNFLNMLDRKKAADEKGTEAKVLETAWVMSTSGGGHLCHDFFATSVGFPLNVSLLLDSSSDNVSFSAW